MGASVAYHLAQQGAGDILLLEREAFFGQGASGKNAGGVRYQFSTEINVRLSQLSLPMLDRFHEELGQSIDRQKCGYLFLLTNERDRRAFEKNVAMQRRLGVATEWLTAGEVAERLPPLKTDDVLAGTIYPEDGLVDPNGLVLGYIAGARRLGVTALTDVTVTGMERRGERITAIQTNRGRVAGEIVVNAAGPWSALISDMAGVPLPVTPVKRQMLVTTPLPQLPADFPFVVDFARSLYFHREGEGLLTGMSNPNQEAGYDERVDEEWELIHMEAAIERFPLLANAGRAAHWAGLYEMTPDAHPIISGVPERPGYYLVTGFSGHGLMHGPIAGLLLSEIILHGQATTLDISSLDYRRFAEGRLIQEYNVI